MTSLVCSIIHTVVSYMLVLIFICLRGGCRVSFSQTWVVTYTAKVCALVMIIVLNLFFLYYTLLHTSQRDYSYQKNFVSACLFQFLVEAFFYESVECYWVGSLLTSAMPFDNIHACRLFFYPGSFFHTSACD
jgi:hypothetical protein